MSVHSALTRSIPTELVERLEAAERGAPDLDMEVSKATGQWWMAHPDRDVAGPWTQSLDAALALAERVLPGLAWSMGQNVHHRHWIAYALAVDAGGLPVEPTHGSAPTPALALCIAILKATAASSVGTSACASAPTTPGEGEGL